MYDTKNPVSEKKAWIPLARLLVYLEECNTVHCSRLCAKPFFKLLHNFEHIILLHYVPNWMFQFNMRYSEFMEARYNQNAGVSLCKYDSKVKMCHQPRQKKQYTTLSITFF